jgi:hypothetical protein
VRELGATVDTGFEPPGEFDIEIFLSYHFA